MVTNNLVQLTPFRADVSRALARRGRALLESHDLAAEMAALEPLEAYLIVKELGVGDAQALLAHASSEQLQTFVDLDCWSQGELQPQDLDAWLAGCSGEDPEVAAELFLKLDNELQLLFLGDAVTVHDAQGEDPPPEPADDERRWQSPDTFFVVHSPADSEREVDPVRLIDLVYRNDVHEGFRLLTALRWELPSGLTHEALRLRDARLEDLGFLPRSEAFKIFAPPPTRGQRDATHHVAPVPIHLPALYAAPLADASLLARGLALITDSALLEAIEHELVYLINTAIVAYGESPRDFAHVHEIAHRVRDTVSLGLEALLASASGTHVGDTHLDAPNPVLDIQAAALLGTWHAKHLFQRGHQEVVPLQKAAYALAKDPVVARWLEQADAENDDYGQDRRDRAFMRSLIGIPPLFAGFDPVKPLRTKAFGSKQELATAEEVLNGLVTRIVG